MGARLAHCVYWTAVVLLVAIAAFLRFALDSTPFCDPDTWGYLHPALSSMSGGRFVHTSSRSFPYPGFLLLILRVGGDARLVTVVQHVLGLSAGLLMLRAWLMLRPALPDRPWIHVVHPLAGLLLLAAVLLSNDGIVFEHSLRPEAVSAFLLAVIVLLGTRLTLGSLCEPRLSNAQISLTSLALLLVSGLAYFVRPNFILATPVSVLLVVFLAWRTCLGVRATVAILLAAAVVIWAALAAPERALARDDPESRVALTGLMFIHMNLAVDELGRQAGDPQRSDEDRRLRRRLAELFAEELARYAQSLPRDFKSLGFDPDRLFYGAAGELLARHFGSDGKDEQAAFCAGVFASAVRRHPRAYLKKVGRQLAVVYRNDFRVFGQQGPLPVRRMYQYGLESLAAYSERSDFGPLARRLLEDSAHAAAFPVTLSPGAPALDRILSAPVVWLGKRHVAVLIIASIAGLALTIRHVLNRLAGRPGLPVAMGLGVLVLALNAWSFGIHLTAATVHVLEVSRYFRMQQALIVYVILANVLFALASLDVLVRGRDAGRESHLGDLDEAGLA